MREWKLREEIGVVENAGRNRVGGKFANGNFGNLANRT